MESHIIPAIIASTQDEFEEMVHLVKDQAEIIQIDVMDGRFVNNKSFQFDFSPPPVNCRYEAHLMLKNPVKWIELHGHKVDTILVHAEVVMDKKAIIELARMKGKKIGFVLNPPTPIDQILKELEQIDEVLIMTVHPGKYGSPFLPETLIKVEMLRSLAPSLGIEVDGGISDETIVQAKAAGANLFVSGSYIMRNKNPGNVIRLLKKLIND